MRNAGTRFYRHVLYRIILCVQRGSQFHVALMRFANLPRTPRFPQMNPKTSPEDARLVDRVSVSARSCLFATDYKHWESKGKRATKTEERYLLLFRWISFHGILSNSIQSPPLRKALSVSPASAHPMLFSPSLP